MLPSSLQGNAAEPAQNSLVKLQRNLLHRGKALAEREHQNSRSGMLQSEGTDGKETI